MAILNARPFSTLGSDLRDATASTAGHFLGASVLGLAPYKEERVKFPHKFQHSQNCISHFIQILAEAVPGLAQENPINRYFCLSVS